MNPLPESRSRAAGVQRKAETVVVMGGGIAGLGVALALRESNHEVVIVERDLPPDDFAPELAFERWKRPGVVQFRHPHVFQGRLQRLLQDRHPVLLSELLEAGLWQIPVSEYGNFRAGYEYAAGDEDLTQLCGRRATFEYVLQRYVRKLPNVRMIHGASVESIGLRGQGADTRMHSVEIKSGTQRESIAGDVFVDCLGRRSPVFEWLRQHQRAGKQQSQDSQSIYYSRHYRLHPGAKPQLDEQSGDLDFLRYAIVYAEHRHFAIGLSIDDGDSELSQRIKRADGFDAACHAIPQLRDWLENAEALTPVMGMGDIRNRWVESTQRGQPLALGLLHAGDSARETNPFYGRGCSAALVSAHLLADVLHETSDTAERGRTFEARMRAELQPYYDLSVATDRMFRARSLAARGVAVSPVQRWLGNMYLAIAVPAAFEDATVARAFLGIQHMRRPYSVSAKLQLIWRLLYLALRRLPKRVKAAPLVLPQRSRFVDPSADRQVSGARALPVAYAALEAPPRSAGAVPLLEAPPGSAGALNEDTVRVRRNTGSD